LYSVHDFREGDPRREQQARTFGEIAELYDRARSGYPQQLFDELFRLAEMTRAVRL
jgi:hypothetical protein